MSADGVAQPVTRRETGVHLPASNLHLCSALTLAAVVVILLAVAVIDSRGSFLLVGTVIVVAAVFLVRATAQAKPHGLETTLAALANRVDRRLSFGDGFSPNVLFVVLYSAGVVGAVGAYAYMALTPYNVRPEDAADWHMWMLDKRMLVFGYLIAAALPGFHGFMTGFFLDRKSGEGLAGAVASVARPYWMTRVLGGVLISVLAYCWIGLPALRSVIPSESGLASFFDVHIHVHLAAMEQMRLGAQPFLEAYTQYGMGNQVLMFWLVDALGFNNHSFHAVNVLLNVVCMIVFFVFLQQVLGFGWAFAGLVGWTVLPSPDSVMTFSGWAILTRSLLIPVLAILMARTLLNPGPRTNSRLGVAVVTGVVWGVGAFLSQESRSAGFLVIVLSVLLFGPASGMTLRALVGFALTVIVSGTVVLVAAAAAVVGPGHVYEAFQVGNSKSGLVLAGYGNSIWSHDVGFTIALNTLNGRLYSSLQSQGDLWPVFAVYGLVILLPVTVVLLARVLRRHWPVIDARERDFVWKFGGVTVGAFVLHTLPLLRSDAQHLYGPAFLLPLFLIMLPLFAWRCIDRGAVRNVLRLIVRSVQVRTA